MPKLHEMYNQWQQMVEFKKEVTEKVRDARVTLDLINKQYVNKDTFNS